ncbi:MAG TPA: amidohydrolase family protein [Microbacteriaceae bacterium]|nr:amidohydrolase family protein [Microbacteriaceae bacterium]
MIDALAIIGENLFGASLDLDSHLSTLEALGVGGAVVAPARGRDYRFDTANDRLAAAVEGRAEVRWLARVDPNQADAAVAELRRCIAAGASGVYLDPDQDVFRVVDSRQVVTAAADSGLASVIAAGAPLRAEPLQFDDLAQSVPHARIVLTSGGQINISGLSMIDAWLALTRNPNLHVLSNGEYRQDYLERLANELDPERLLFASMAPLHDQRFELDRIRSARFDASQRELIEHENAARLFAFAGGRSRDGAARLPGAE